MASDNEIKATIDELMVGIAYDVAFRRARAEPPGDEHLSLGNMLRMRQPVGELPIVAKAIPGLLQRIITEDGNTNEPRSPLVVQELLKFAVLQQATLNELPIVVHGLIATGRKLAAQTMFFHIDKVLGEITGTKMDRKGFTLGAEMCGYVSHRPVPANKPVQATAAAAL